MRTVRGTLLLTPVGKTNQTEVKYAPTQLEVAANVFAVEHFEVYLLGNVFTVFYRSPSPSQCYPGIHLKSQSRGLLA